MKSRRDFNEEAEYAEYLKTYATIQAMNGLLSTGAMYDGKVNNKKLVEDAANHADEVMALIYKPGK